jgi:hypothetical protein
MQPMHLWTMFCSSYAGVISSVNMPWIGMDSNEYKFDANGGGV